MFARRRFEFPHIALLDHDDNVAGVVQLDAVLLARHLVWRSGPCGHPRWPQWWVPVRVMRNWAFVPVEADVPRLLDHHGNAALKATPHGAKFECVGLVLPTGTRITVRDTDGEVIS